MFNYQQFVHQFSQRLFIEQNSLRVSALSDIVSPKFCHAFENPTRRYGFCHLQEMNRDQVAWWVWTFSYCKGWGEGWLYGRNFWKEGISGWVLDMVDMKILKSFLGISNKDHRVELLSEIRRLLPKKSVTWRSMEVEHRAPDVIGDVKQPSFEVLSTDTRSHLSSTFCASSITDRQVNGGSSLQRSTLSFCNGNARTKYVTNNPNLKGCESVTPGYHFLPCNSTMAESLETGTTDGTSLFCFTERSRETADKVDLEKRLQIGGNTLLTEISGLSDASTFKNRKPLKYRQLVLTLQNDQISQEEDINRIRSWFLELDPDVVVKELNKGNTYTIAFQDSMRAKEALIKFRNEGYMIKFKFPRRPNPRAPMKYVALESLTIRSGKAFSGDILGQLSKGQKVTVDQVKGRRARLIKPDQEVKKWGWVSLYSRDEGKPLLIQLQEITPPRGGIPHSAAELESSKV